MTGRVVMLIYQAGYKKSERVNDSFPNPWRPSSMLIGAWRKRFIGTILGELGYSEWFARAGFFEGARVWKCRVPHCTQWFCWSLSCIKMAISLGILTQHVFLSSSTVEFGVCCSEVFVPLAFFSLDTQRAGSHSGHISVDSKPGHRMVQDGIVTGWNGVPGYHSNS